MLLLLATLPLLVAQAAVPEPTLPPPPYGLDRPSIRCHNQFAATVWDDATRPEGSLPLPVHQHEPHPFGNTTWARRASGWLAGPPLQDAGLRELLPHLVRPAIVEFGSAELGEVLIPLRDAAGEAPADVLLTRTDGNLVWHLGENLVMAGVATRVHVQGRDGASATFLAAPKLTPPVRNATAAEAVAHVAVVDAPGAAAAFAFVAAEHPEVLLQPTLVHGAGMTRVCPPTPAEAFGECLAAELAAVVAALHAAGTPSGVVLFTGATPLLPSSHKADAFAALDGALSGALLAKGVPASVFVEVNARGGGHRQPVWLVARFSGSAAAVPPLPATGVALQAVDEAGVVEGGEELPCNPEVVPGFWRVARTHDGDDPFYTNPIGLQHRLRWVPANPRATCPQPRYVDALRKDQLGVEVPVDELGGMSTSTAVPSTSWLRDRVIALIGDSYDRNLVTAACDAVGGRLHVVTPQCPVRNTSAATFVSPFRGALPLHCHVDSLNLHFVVVFVLGVTTIHEGMVVNHVDPFQTQAQQRALMAAADRLRQASHLLQASRLSPDVVTMTSVHWDLLNLFMDYAKDIDGRNPFTSDWVQHVWAPNANDSLVATAKALFPSASYFAWRTVPPVNEPNVRSRKGVYFSDPGIPKPFQNFDNDKAAIMNAAGRALAVQHGMGVFDLERVMYGQGKFLHDDGYHWSRHINLRMFELLLAQLHHHFV